MKKDSIVQFVCFVTTLEPADFIKKWEPVSRKLAADCESMLQESITAKAKYKYILQHEGSAVDFRLSFMKNRSRESSPEHRARLVHVGGYTPVQFQSLHSAIEDDVKILAFIDHKESDVDLAFYHQQVYRYLNIYQAYYESCAYSYVLEFYIQQYDAPALIAQLKTRSGVEVSSYKESAVFHC